MENVDFKYVLITFKGKEDINDYNIGSVLLSCNDRSFILDITQTGSEFDEINKTTTFLCSLSIDKDNFDELDSLFDLTINDMLSPELTGVLCMDKFEGKIKTDTQTLFYEVDGIEKTLELNVVF